MFPKIRHIHSSALMLGLVVASLSPLLLKRLSFEQAPVALSSQPSENMLEGRLGPFRIALAENYQTLSKLRAAERSGWSDAQYFSLKAEQARQGALPQPEELTRWWLPPPSLAALGDKRMQLMALLTDEAREKAPLAAARAQASFDCWVERAEKNWDKAGVQKCAHDFEEALSEIASAM